MVYTTMEGRKKVVMHSLWSKRVTVVFRCGARAPLDPAGEEKWYYPQGGGENAEQAFFKDKMIQILENQRAKVSRGNRRQAHKRTLFQKEFSSLTKKIKNVPPTHLFCSISSF